ncbi:hypothetical protein JM47_02955 [Ureaplasma diversum]|uniref:Lipoprotein n=1 Tax=Ureaplasma diversum TaxID=42094 RepID=A0A0C5RQ37_9BACT|nr:hypothetical protein [Ureaplasma diversum]AJQ45504.1 hypothetical protein JM47_02955 [Ureaplasma diversum]
MKINIKFKIMASFLFLSIAPIIAVSCSQKNKNPSTKSTPKKSLLEENIKITDPTVVKQTQPLVALKPAQPITTSFLSQPNAILLNNLNNYLELKDNKYLLSFGLNSLYKNKYVQIQLQKADDQNVLITSNKTKIANDGSVLVAFENLEDDNEYIIKKVLIYDDLNNDSKSSDYQITNEKEDLSVFSKLSDIKLSANAKIIEYFYNEFKLRLNNLSKWKDKVAKLVIQNLNTNEEFYSLETKIKSPTQDFIFDGIYSVYDQYKIVKLEYEDGVYLDEDERKRTKYTSIPLDDSITNKILSVKYKTNLNWNPFTNDKNKERLVFKDGVNYLTTDNKPIYAQFSRHFENEKNIHHKIISARALDNNHEDATNKIIFINNKEELATKIGFDSLDKNIKTDFNKKTLVALLLEEEHSYYNNDYYNTYIAKKYDVDPKTKTINVELEYNYLPKFSSTKEIIKRRNSEPTAIWGFYVAFFFEVDQLDDIEQYKLKLKTKKTDYETWYKKPKTDWDSLPWNK